MAKTASSTREETSLATSIQELGVSIALTCRDLHTRLGLNALHTLGDIKQNGGHILSNSPLSAVGFKAEDAASQRLFTALDTATTSAVDAARNISRVHRSDVMSVFSNACRAAEVALRRNG